MAVVPGAVIHAKDAEIARLRAQNELLRQANEALEQTNETLLRQLHARRSERFVSAGDEQLNLFAEVDEHIDVEEPAEPTQPEAAVTKHPGRNPLPAHFPLEVEIVSPGQIDAERGDYDEAKLEREGHVLIGYQTSERVAYRPAQYVRILQKRPTYRNLATGEITTAHARDRVLARSIA